MDCKGVPTEPSRRYSQQLKTARPLPVSVSSSGPQQDPKLDTSYNSNKIQALDNVEKPYWISFNILRAITSRCTSLVPSPMVIRRASRYMRSTGYSRL